MSAVFSSSPTLGNGKRKTEIQTPDQNCLHYVFKESLPVQGKVNVRIEFGVVLQ